MPAMRWCGYCLTEENNVSRKPKLYLQDPSLEELEEELETLRERELELDPERDFSWGNSDFEDCDE